MTDRVREVLADHCKSGIVAHLIRAGDDEHASVGVRTALAAMADHAIEYAAECVALERERAASIADDMILYSGQDIAAAIRAG